MAKVRTNKDQKVKQEKIDQLIEKRNISQLLIEGAEMLTLEEFSEKKLQREKEKIFLRGGLDTSVYEINLFVTPFKQDYYARFPNDNPFFSNMFRLHPKLYGLDWKNYNKPYLAGKLLTKLIYDRFENEYSTEVLKELIVFAMPNGIRIYKCHEFLTDKGVELLLTFRNEANEMMKKYKDLEWSKFEDEYLSTYKRVFQPKLF